MINRHYLDGKWLKTEDLKISAFDLAVVRGFGVFDFLRTYNRLPFYLDDHLDRFFNSAKLLQLKIPKSKDEIKKIIFEGIEKNPAGELNVKIILTGGETIDGITPVGKHVLLITFTGAVEYPKELYQKGVKVITIKGSRFLPQAKYLNYTQAVLAMMRAKKEGAEEALYVDEKGRITEATRANFFAVIGGHLVTPKNGVLFGITRKVVLKLAA
ncbi:MAG: aminotransferase class IV, partial [Microgenomates group bacterium]